MGLVYRMGPCGANHGIPWDMNVNGGIYGLQEWTPRWGGKRGTKTKIMLGENEYFTNVTCHVGQYMGMTVVRSLTFFTNVHRRFGPFGENDGSPFELPAAGGKIVGFHGRAGTLIDAFGIYVQMP